METKKQSKPMTLIEAQEEAKRRWGLRAWVFMDNGNQHYVYSRGTTDKDYEKYIGTGDSWEAAFADATMRTVEIATKSFPVLGYHTREITKGVLGEPSKIREELEELEDAIAQGNTILAHCELADLYGALEACAKSHGLSMEQLRVMADATARAFKSGSRK